MSAPGRIEVGVVVERRKAASQWIDYVWQPVSVLPGRPEAEPWMVLAREDNRTTFYAGTTIIDECGDGTPAVCSASAAIAPSGSSLRKPAFQ